VHSSNYCSYFQLFLLKTAAEMAFVFGSGMLARISHQLSTAAAHPGFLMGVLGLRTLRRSVELGLGFSALQVPVIRPVYAAALRNPVRNAG